MNSFSSVLNVVVLALLLCSMQSARADHDIPVVEGMNAALGEGYSTTQDRFKGACVTGTLGPIASPTVASFDFSASVSREQIANELGFDAKGRAQLGVVGVGMAAKFMKASVGDAYSISALYSGYYKFQDDAISSPVLTPMAANLTEISRMGNTVIKNPELWEKTCGDEFVDRREFGAKLYFSIRIDFKSEEEKNFFSSRIKLDAPLVQADAAVKSASQSLSKDTRITVSGLQIGGDVRKLTSIFGSSKGGTISAQTEDGATAFINCSMGDFSKCKAVLASAVSYATNTKEGFPSQLNRRTGQALLTIHTKPYETLSVYNNHTTQAKQGFENARGKLIELFNHNYDLSVQTSRVIQSPILRLSPRQEGILRQADRSISKNIARLVDASQRCFEVPSECVSQLAIFQGQPLSESVTSTSTKLSRFLRWDNAPWTSKPKIEKTDVNPLVEIDPQIFFIRPETFAQHCDLGQSSLTCADERLRLTINSLIAKAYKIDSAPFKNNNDRCGVTENIFNRQTSLDLSAEMLVEPYSDPETRFPSSISDLNAISTLTHLKELNLEGNAISDLSPLSALVNLKKLNLNKNNISNLDGLEELKNLEELYISENRITSADQLTSLPNLKVIHALNNLRGLKRPSQLPLSVGFLSHNYSSGYSVTKVERSVGPGQVYNHTGELVIQALSKDRILVVCNEGKTCAIMDPLGKCQLLDDVHGTATKCFGLEAQANLLGNGSVLVTSYRSAFLFEQTKNRFVPLPDLSRLREYHTTTSFVDGGKEYVLFLGGSNGYGKLASADLYDVGAKTYTPLGVSMAFPRSYHRSVLLQNGKILITGGDTGNSQATQEAEIFDPLSRSFTRTHHAMNVPRIGHQMTVLPDGKVLITGGYTDWNSAPEDSAEIYDPADDTFTLLDAKMMEPRTFHSSELLEDGSVLILAGFHIMKGSTMDSAEIFDPILQKFHPLSTTLIPRKRNRIVIPVSQSRMLVLGDHALRSLELFSYPPM